MMIMALLLILGVGGYFMMKDSDSTDTTKVQENGGCTADADCADGLKCTNTKCTKPDVKKKDDEGMSTTTIVLIVLACLAAVVGVGFLAVTRTKRGRDGYDQVAGYLGGRKPPTGQNMSV